MKLQIFLDIPADTDLTGPIYMVPKTAQEPETTPTPEPVDPIPFGKAYMTFDQTVFPDQQLLSIKKGRDRKLAWEHDDSQTGPFSTFFDGKNFLHFSQKRAGGNIRLCKSVDGVAIGKSTTRVVMKHKGKEIDNFRLEGMWYDSRNGWCYGLANYEDDLWIFSQENSPNAGAGTFDTFSLWTKIPITGAKDTSHGLFHDVDSGEWFIYGRKRNVNDWIGETNPILIDRRGVRILKSNSPEGPWVEMSPIDPKVTQPGYKNNKNRQDYYSMRVTKFMGNYFGHISTFCKNEDRVPSTRPDRTTGTGPIIPTPWYSADGLSWTQIGADRSLVDLKRHERNWPFPECAPYLPEVGQIYGNSLIPLGDDLVFFYNDREDTHYLPLPEEKQRIGQTWVDKIPRGRITSFKAGITTTEWITPPDWWDQKSLSLETDGPVSYDIERAGGTCRITFTIPEGSELFWFKFNK